MLVKLYMSNSIFLKSQTLIGLLCTYFYALPRKMGIASPIRRICHWGPLTAIGIIKIVTLTTIHCCRQWWIPYQGYFATTIFLIFFALSGSTLYHFLNAIFEGPGFLPPNWEPKNKDEREFLQYCTVCQGYKAPRSHHCRKCGRCVMKMDHHCPWINNCVGHQNHGYFTAFLASAVGGCSISTYILISWLMRALSPPFTSGYSTPPPPPPSLLLLIIVIFTIGLSIGIVLAVGMLLYFQISAIVRNKTAIEDWILEKADYRRFKSDKKFVYPYSKGRLFNIKQVVSWHCVPSGDGIFWPVVDGCDQYTLTCEQLAQKKEKRNRTRQYRVISKVSGSWFPISYGLKVLCSPPYTDESRIKLDIGDVVLVTRWRKHWLFGQKEMSQVVREGGKISRVRGWFPRSSAIEVIENEQDQRTNENDDLTSSATATTTASFLKAQ